MTANQAATRVTKHLRFTPTSDLRGRRFRMSALSDLFSSSRVRPVGVGPRPRGATVGDRPLAKVARPEGLPKVVIPTNRQDHLSLFFGKNRDDDQSQRPKVRGTDQSHVPEGDVKNLRMWRAAQKQGATNAMPHKA